jgi:hypothetical protein
MEIKKICNDAREDVNLFIYQNFNLSLKEFQYVNDVLKVTEKYIVDNVKEENKV